MQFAAARRGFAAKPSPGALNSPIIAAMTAIAIEVKGEVSSRNNTQVDDRHGPLTTNHGLPVGIQILAGANNEAMAVAHAAGLDFIRAEGYVYAPNVNAVEEMVDMISASRSYQNNIEVMNTSKELLLATLRLGQ